MKKHLFGTALAVLFTAIMIIGCGTPKGPSTTEKILSATNISNGVSDDDMNKFLSFAQYNDLTKSELKNCLILMKKAGLNTDYVVKQSNSLIYMKIGADDYVNPGATGVGEIVSEIMQPDIPKHTFLLEARVDKDKDGNKVLSRFNLLRGPYETDSKGSEVPIYNNYGVKNNLVKFILTNESYKKLEKKAAEIAIDELKDFEKGISNIKLRYAEVFPFVCLSMFTFSDDEFYYKVLVEFEYEKKTFAGTRREIAYADDMLFDEKFKYVGRKGKEKKFTKGSKKEYRDLLYKAISGKTTNSKSMPSVNEMNDNSKAITPNIGELKVKIGVITGDEVNIRKGPSTKYESKGYFFKGDKVRVVGQGTDGNHIWYKVEYDNPQYGLIVGYVRSDFVKM